MTKHRQATPRQGRKVLRKARRGNRKAYRAWYGRGGCLMIMLALPVAIIVLIVLAYR